ncbi:unnamed protein product [Cyclocybe aegerita]|uniref:Reverse transcriptase domain-containing protein n=1 Tax=Cyclocybe aegerita TaxID=1973307 RepID=A0A8S0W2H6_CYCAE|nr:unnamed protein product [Cyclocybe aegerita]
MLTSALQTANTVQDDNEQPQPTVKQPSKMAGKTSNPIYRFYKKVTTDADGMTSDGTKYFKCYHGTRKTVKITKGMKGSLNNLVGHLQRPFPAHHCLYEVLAKRRSPLTKEEIEIASGKKRMDDALVKKYLNELETEPWDQAHFETLVAKWVAACDQPFSAVEDEEFHEMLQYIHRQSHGKLKIPSQKGVHERILEMETEMVDGFQAMFKTPVPNQLGGIRQRSTEDAGLILTHLVRAGWVKGLQTSTLAFGITQFFPSINHEMFMAVLHKQGFSPVLVDFFASYLVGRSTVYCWNTFQSNSQSADMGVRQGSALSPVISGLFIAPVMKLFYIKAVLLNTTLLSFVDDGTIWARSKQLDDNNVGLHKAYKIIYLLFVAFALVLEHDKTELFHFLRRQDTYNPLLDLGYAPHTGATPLKPKTYWRYLGFYFNRRLTFHEHICYYATKAFTTMQAMCMLGNSTRGLSPKQRHLLYRSC